MERLAKKFEQRYKRAQDAVEQWSVVQARLVRLFANAACIVHRIPVLLVDANYGALGPVEGMTEELPAKQVESLEKIFVAVRQALQEMEAACKVLEKLWRDANNLLRNEKPKPTPEQARQRVGSRASLDDFVNGLRELYVMHRDECALKAALISALTCDTRPSDITALQTVLEDQPNIPPDEVEAIFSLAFAGA